MLPPSGGTKQFVAVRPAFLSIVRAARVITTHLADLQSVANERFEHRPASDYEWRRRFEEHQ